MPQLIKSPEDIFRETAKDVYLIRFRERREEKEAHKDITEWVNTHLPGTRVERLGPSEYSGYLSYLGDIWIDFSAEGLAKFCEHWETAEGKSIDERFQCHVMPYQEWYDQHGRFVPTREKPAGMGVTTWIHTPIGFIHHQFDKEEAPHSVWRYPPANHREIWMHAVRLWPELAEVELDKLAYGVIFQSPPDNKWVVTLNASAWRSSRPEEEMENMKRALRAWFHIPDEIEIADADF